MCISGVVAYFGNCVKKCQHSCSLLSGLGAKDEKAGEDDDILEWDLVVEEEDALSPSSEAMAAAPSSVTSDSTLAW